MKSEYAVSTNSNHPGNVTWVADGAILSGFAVLAALSLAGLKFIMSRAISQIDQKMLEMSDRLKKIELVEDTIQDFKTEAARQYVTREEWIRAVTVSDAKLDAVHRRLDQISDRIMLILAKGERNE